MQRGKNHAGTHAAFMTSKLADLCYDSKRDIRLHRCDVFLWIVDMYKQVVLICVKVTARIQLRYIMTVISAAVDNRNAI